MKLGKYQALDKKELSVTFIDYVDSLKMPIIDYVAIGVQDTIHKTSTSLMSRPDWQKTFRDLNLAEYDPVRKASFNTKSKIFAFDELDYQDSCGKEVMRQRRKHNIENGIVLMRRNLGHNFMMTFATGFKNFYPYKFFLDHQLVINKIFDDLICLVSPLTTEYQFKINHYRDGDAK